MTFQYIYILVFVRSFFSFLEKTFFGWIFDNAFYFVDVFVLYECGPRIDADEISSINHIYWNEVECIMYKVSYDLCPMNRDL